MELRVAGPGDLRSRNGPSASVRLVSFLPIGEAIHAAAPGDADGVLAVGSLATSSSAQGLAVAAEDDGLPGADIVGTDGAPGGGLGADLEVHLPTSPGGELTWPCSSRNGLGARSRRNLGLGSFQVSGIGRGSGADPGPGHGTALLVADDAAERPVGHGRGRRSGECRGRRRLDDGLGLIQGLRLGRLPLQGERDGARGGDGGQGGPQGDFQFGERHGLQHLPREGGRRRPLAERGRPGLRGESDRGPDRRLGPRLGRRGGPRPEQARREGDPPPGQPGLQLGPAPRQATLERPQPPAEPIGGLLLREPFEVAEDQRRARNGSGNRPSSSCNSAQRLAVDRDARVDAAPWPAISDPWLLPRPSRLMADERAFAETRTATPCSQLATESAAAPIRAGRGGPGRVMSPASRPGRRARRRGHGGRRRGPTPRAPRPGPRTPTPPTGRPARRRIGRGAGCRRSGPRPSRRGRATPRRAAAGGRCCVACHRRSSPTSAPSFAV